MGHLFRLQCQQKYVSTKNNQNLYIGISPNLARVQFREWKQERCAGRVKENICEWFTRARQNRICTFDGIEGSDTVRKEIYKYTAKWNVSGRVLKNSIVGEAGGSTTELNLPFRLSKPKIQNIYRITFDWLNRKQFIGRIC